MKKLAAAVLAFPIFIAIQAPQAQAQQLIGAGSTFDYPIFSKWFAEYSAAHPGVEINYQSIGSGGGIRQFCSGLVDFGASDMPMTRAMIRSCKIEPVHIPVVVGAVAPIFNVPGISNLRFSGEMLAGIYLGKIVDWNDPAIARENPGVRLPALKITVVHRSDGSGTSFIFTEFLSLASAEWKNGPGSGTSPGWPLGVGGKGNEGVAGLVRELPGAIGYVELIYALQNHIAMGAVRNANGEYITPSLASATAAAASVKNIPPDMRISIIDSPGAGAYPISSFSWIVAPEADSNTAKGRVLIDLLSWIVKSGQAESAALSYAPLPPNIVQEDLKTIYSLKP